MCKGALNTMRQMKNSGISWVGDIPQSWNICRVKDAFFRKNKKAYQNNPQILTLARNGVKIRDISTNEGQIAESYFEYNPVDIDDLLLNPMDLQSGDNCSISKVKGVISPAYFNIKNRADFYPDFYNYVFKTYYWSMVLFSYGKGVSFDNRWTLNFDTLSRLFIVNPTFTEQKRIANYLNKECEKIDGLKADIQAQIDTLEQYKRSVITEAVTHGLNHDVFMKDSGAGWVPIVPQHWRVEKLKYNLCQRSVKNQTDKQVLSLYREYGIVPKDSRDDNHNVTSEDVSDYRYVRVGDFVVNKMKAWQGSVAVSNYEGIVSPAYFVYEFSNKDIDGKYFHYLIRNKTYTAEFRRLSGGIREGQWDLPAEALNNTYILIPPFDEQKAIAEYLDHKCAEIEQIIADKKAQLETLDNYKKSLIYEYVTGKKEVVL